MQSFPLRVSAAGWLTTSISTAYLIALAVIVILNFKGIDTVSGGSRALFVFVIGAMAAPLLGILWVLSKKRIVQIGYGQFAVSDGHAELDRIQLSEIGQVTITTQRRCLTVYDRFGNQRIQLKPHSGAQQIDRAVDYLRTQLPHLERQEVKGKGQHSVVNRYIDFPQPTSAPRQPQSPGQPFPGQQFSGF